MRLRFTFATLLASVMVLAGLLTASVVSVSADAGSTIAGSPFNGSNGTLDSNSGPANADTPSGKNDNAFGQGTKEDQTLVNVVTGSIPPNKNDLTNLYANGGNGTTPATASHVFLYLGWTRAVNTGSANLDFEFNKTQFALPLTDTKNVALNRQAGDLLFLYDFGGSGAPVLTEFEWITSGTCSVGSDSAPCWGASSGTLVSEASISANGLFGEAVIDLTASGVIPSGSCESFQQAYAKARASTSLGAEMKDFISPGPINVNTCGAAAVKKTDAQTGATLAGATFTLTDSANKLIATVTSGSDGTACVGGLNQGTYTWTETAAPPGYVIVPPASQTVNVNAVSSCPTTPFVTTFTDLAKGAVAVKKVSDKGSVALAGATITLKDSANTVVGTVTTDANGTGCVGNLVQGTYTWTETAAPTGFAIDTTSQQVVLNAGSSCPSTTFVTTFGDAPLTDITATAKSEATTGGSQTTITCKDSQGNNVGNSPQGPAGQAAVAANGLKPGTYTCVLVVDP